MATVPSRRRRTRQTKRQATPTTALSIFVLAVSACSSSHQLAGQQPTAASAESDDPTSQTVSPRVPERRTARVVYCEDLESDPLRGLTDQEPECVPSPPRASTPEEECRDICIDAIIVDVDEDYWKVIRVEVLDESGKRTPAIVHRTAGYGGPSREVGERTKFICAYRYDDDHGMPHYGDCYQGSPEARHWHEIDELSGPGDVGPSRL